MIEPALVEADTGNVGGLFANFSENPVGVAEGNTFFPSTVNDTGCTPYKLPSNLGPMIVVVRRGDCPFVEKAMHAQSAGADGLIVVSDNDLPILMAGEGEDHGESVHIFVVSLSKEDGESLLVKG